VCFGLGHRLLAEENVILNGSGEAITAGDVERCLRSWKLSEEVDVRLANRIGMKSVWFKWNNRYQETISNEEERPDFVIKSLPELLGILSSR